jgi:mRNA interferase MazF
VRRGDIHVAATRGVHTGKPRPVVIVQDDRFDATASVTVCPLTINPVDAPLIRIAVEPTAATGIEQLSQIMVDKITTMPRANPPRSSRPSRRRRSSPARSCASGIPRISRMMATSVGPQGFSAMGLWPFAACGGRGTRAAHGC